MIVHKNVIFHNNLETKDKHDSNTELLYYDRKYKERI